jgi:hypothetical protein
MAPAEFFGAMLPAIIATRRDLFDAAPGRLCVVVHGVGAWTITFGDHTSKTAVEPQLDFDADLVATFTPKGFETLLAGEALDVEHGEPVWMGDLKLLDRFGRLLVPPSRGGIAARIANL